MKKLVCILLACLLCSASALAGTDSSICWTLFSDIDTDDRRAFTRILDPDTGKSKDYDHPGGYIIQKDFHEYPGVLYARMDTEALRIVHRAPSGKEETVYEGPNLAVYWANGDQTVRAFMDGCLYYIKVLEYTGTSIDFVSQQVHPNRTNGQFCRIDADGNEYVYQLGDRTSTARPSDFSALHPNGTLAWIEREYNEQGDGYSRMDILVESPEDGCRTLVDLGTITDLGYAYISDGLCWLDEHTLLFLVLPENPESVPHTLLTIDTLTQQIKPLTNRKGKTITLKHPYLEPENDLGPVSAMTLDRSGRYIAYFVRDYQDDGFGVMKRIWSVPAVLDLKTGKVYKSPSYQNSTDNDLGNFNETRYFWGQLSWIKN